LGVYTAFYPDADLPADIKLTVSELAVLIHPDRDL
jgi:hypothetical protein